MAIPYLWRDLPGAATRPPGFAELGMEAWHAYVRKPSVIDSGCPRSASARRIAIFISRERFTVSAPTLHGWLCIKDEFRGTSTPASSARLLSAPGLNPPPVADRMPPPPPPRPPRV